MTVTQAMQEFISKLELSSCKRSSGEDACGSCTRCNARRQRDAIREHLEEELSVKEFLISGSFKRKTAIKPLNDIDLFVVLDPDAHEDLVDAAPLKILKEIQRILDDAYPNKEHPIVQDRSVNIEFSGTKLAFDVVPAFPDEENDGYRIPDRRTNSWISTNPRVHAEHSTAANERAGNKAKPLVKALKCWNKQSEPKVLRSFHLELMVYDVLKSDPGPYADGIAWLLRKLADRVQSSMPDPAGVGPDVDAQLSEADRRRARRLLLDGADVADEAIELAKDGKVEEAHYKWRQLLGSTYPEKGKAPKSKAPAVAAAAAPVAVDPRPRRFG